MENIGCAYSSLLTIFGFEAHAQSGQLCTYVSKLKSRCRFFLIETALYASHCTRVLSPGTTDPPAHTVRVYCYSSRGGPRSSQVTMSLITFLLRQRALRPSTVVTLGERTAQI